MRINVISLLVLLGYTEEYYTTLPAYTTGQHLGAGMVLLPMQSWSFQRRSKYTLS